MNAATVGVIWTIVGFAFGAIADRLPAGKIKSILAAIAHVSPGNVVGAYRALFGVAVLCLFMSGCMASIQQPGQTPAQVSACSNDATLHNVLLGAAGILTTGTATEASIAATQDANVGKTLAITGAATGGAAAALLGASVLVAESYNNDKCAPALPGVP